HLRIEGTCGAVVAGGRGISGRSADHQRHSIKVHMNSDDRSARLAGLLYLLFIPTAGLAFGFGQFFLAGDAATVVANIESHRRFFESAIFLGTAGFIDYIVVALLLYRLLAPAGRGAATLMVALVAVSVPISLAAMAARMDILTMLDSRHAIAALNDDQLN